MRYLPLVVLLLGCSPEEEDDANRPPPVVDTDPFVGGSLEICAGFHSGVYRGDEQGAVETLLFDSGLFTWTFVTPSGEVELLAELVDGAVVGESDQVVVTGTYDLERCRAEGTWAAPDYPEFDGTWAIAFE